MTFVTDKMSSKTIVPELYVGSRLLPHEFDGEHVSGEGIGTADYLSRSPNESVSGNTDDSEDLETLTIEFPNDFNQKKRPSITEVKNKTETPVISMKADIKALRDFPRQIQQGISTKQFQRSSRTKEEWKFDFSKADK